MLSISKFREKFGPDLPEERALWDAHIYPVCRPGYPNLAIFAVGWGKSLLTHGTRAGNTDIDKAASARLPAWQSRGMEDAHESTDKVIRVGIGAEIAAGDGALNGSYEGGRLGRPSQKL